MRSEFRDSGHSAFVSATHVAACRLMALSDAVTRKVSNVGDIAGYMLWGRRQFGGFKPVARREQLWQIALNRLGSRRVRGFEFGVAWGYSTAWWLSRLEDPEVRWDGFDRFTGLPRDWRYLPQGAFDADGQPPKLNDNRVTWHVGDVQDRIGDLDLTRNDDQTWLVLFDLDVFEPSLVAWNNLKGSLRPGDLLCFDEAFDRDERHLLDHYVLPSGTFNLVGTTPTALCLEVAEVSMRTGD